MSLTGVTTGGLQRAVSPPYWKSNSSVVGDQVSHGQHNLHGLLPSVLQSSGGFGRRWTRKMAMGLRVYPYLHDRR